MKCDHSGVKRFVCDLCLVKKSLKIPMGLSEAVNRRTDNTMDKRKRTKGQTTIFRTLHRKLKIEQHEHTKNQWRSQVLRKGKHPS
jgi:hypothetical protein